MFVDPVTDVVRALTSLSLVTVMDFVMFLSKQLTKTEYFLFLWVACMSWVESSCHGKKWD